MLSVQNYFYFCAHCKLSRTKIPSAAFSHSYKRPSPDFGSHQRLPSAPNFLVCCADLYPSQNLKCSLESTFSCLQANLILLAICSQRGSFSLVIL